MEVCCWYSSSTCCDADTLSNLNKPIENSLNYLVNTLNMNPSSRCYLYLYGLSCIYCSSTTNQYIRFNASANLIQVRLCSSVCGKIWEYCASEIKHPINTSDLPHFNSSSQICAYVSDWLSTTLAKVGSMQFSFESFSSNCYTPYNTFIISQSGCVPNYSGAGFGIPVWALPLVAVGVFIICILTCVCMHWTMRRRNISRAKPEEPIEIASAFDPDEDLTDDEASLKYYYYSTSQQKRKHVEVIS